MEHYCEKEDTGNRKSENRVLGKKTKKSSRVEGSDHKSRKKKRVQDNKEKKTPKHKKKSLSIRDKRWSRRRRGNADSMSRTPLS